MIGGTGAEGFGLALRFANAGARVRIGSREAQKAQDAARRVLEAVPAATVEGFANAEAATGAEIVVLTVPLAAQIGILKSLKSSFQPGAILVDATVPLEASIGGAAARTLTVWSGSAAQQAARYAPEGVAVVAAFHSLSADLLAQLDQSIDSDVLLCGDAKEAKAAVAELVAMLPGARAVDAGPLENARLLESLTALLVSLNIRKQARHAGVRITGLGSGH
jgi:8-hydroxy-5-deazaflavin:NADPH oxidoreductase